MSNTRFIDKSKVVTDYDSLLAIVEFYEKGGKIQVVKPSKRPKRGFTVGKHSQELKG